MPKKKGGGGAKKPKDVIDDSEAALTRWDLKPNQLLNTPLGVTVKVAGVRFKAGEDREQGGVLMLEFPGEVVSPVEAQDAAELQARGYVKASDLQRLIHEAEEVSTRRAEEEVAKAIAAAKAAKEAAEEKAEQEKSKKKGGAKKK
eukprot:TRINITY_DN6261_c0_g1::TRINITY_DN6261_c0_g1_i1::g.148::m.148 TRINITY_DN6261_c0_g1::TRINITY_DN6261_c0_g1_i1::g.148  ORF type:complete len:145 (-),score=26.66 TRINITY_DN6261_c0_g1_i1:265-699(-)